MKFSDQEQYFIRNVLKMDVGAEINDETVLCAIQDAAFNVEIAYEFDDVSESIGRQAIALVTRLGQEK